MHYRYFSSAAKRVVRTLAKVTITFVERHKFEWVSYTIERKKKKKFLSFFSWNQKSHPNGPLASVRRAHIHIYIHRERHNSNFLIFASTYSKLLKISVKYNKPKNSATTLFSTFGSRNTKKQLKEYTYRVAQLEKKFPLVKTLRLRRKTRKLLKLRK